MKTQNLFHPIMENLIYPLVLWSHQESNLELSFRRALLYPFNYETFKCPTTVGL